MTGLIAFKLERCRRNSTQRHGAAKPQPNLFGLRREAKRHAALEALSAVEKRCRRCPPSAVLLRRTGALPPQSKILAVFEDSDGWQCKEAKLAKKIKLSPGFIILASLHPGVFALPSVRIFEN